MEMLNDRQLLAFDVGMLEWKWSLSRIQANTNVSDNVVDVIAARIEQLSTRARRILRLASVQGFRFNREVVSRLL